VTQQRNYIALDRGEKSEGQKIHKNSFIIYGFVGVSRRKYRRAKSGIKQQQQQQKTENLHNLALA
jgi:hypothetical protein